MCGWRGVKAVSRIAHSKKGRKLRSTHGRMKAKENKKAKMKKERKKVNLKNKRTRGKKKTIMVRSGTKNPLRIL